jgi:hypothetical protein
VREKKKKSTPNSGRYTNPSCFILHKLINCIDLSNPHSLKATLFTSNGLSFTLRYLCILTTNQGIKFGFRVIIFKFRLSTPPLGDFQYPLTAWVLGAPRGPKNAMHNPREAHEAPPNQRSCTVADPDGSGNTLVWLQCFVFRIVIVWGTWLHSQPLNL